MRCEKDLLGERNVPDEAYYGIHTVRARENFPLTGRPAHPRLIAAIALIKKAAARSNARLGYLPEPKAAAIVQAAEEIMAGRWNDQFVVDALQGGAGTSTHMNVNEVLANRACELLGGSRGDYDLVHPLNDVNMHQSTNDVYPTALRIAAIWLLQPLSEACSRLQEDLQHKESEFAGVIKVGRTQLQDAVPIMLGQEFGAYAQAVARDRWRLYKVEERLRQINLGGTAVGTGLNAPRKYIYMVNELVREYAGMGLAKAENTVDPTQNADVFVEVSGLVKTLAVNISKIAHDLRLLSSGPRSGLGEIQLPEMQAGSSIMPGKVNPVIPEAVNQAAFQIIASDLAITLAAQSGQLELNAFLPLIAEHLLHGIQLLTQAVRLLGEKCIRGIIARPDRCRQLLDDSLAAVTALVPHIGYEKATQIAREAVASGKTIREAALFLQTADEETLDRILNPLAMTAPGVAGEIKTKGRNRSHE